MFLAVLFAAFLHAGWNALVKQGGNKLQSVFVMSTAQGLMGLAILLFLPLPKAEVWPWLIASGIIHSAYKLFLTFAYERGDLSRVYPIARGAAPMMVLIAGAVILSDVVAQLEVAGIILIGFGIALMARGVFTNGESRNLLPWAVASAVATASYSIVDGIGARLAYSATQYVAWMFAIDGVIFAVLVWLRRGEAGWNPAHRELVIGTFAGAASLAAYWIAVWAMTVAPIALVTALRETSILFAMLLGVLIFGERADRGKLIAGALIIAGVVLTRL